MTDDEADDLRSVALQNASAILQARQLAEQELLAAKESLREREALLRAMFAQAGAGIALVDANGRFTDVNQRLCDIWGYSAAELKELTFQALTFPTDLARTVEQLALLVSGERSQISYEKRYVRKDGVLIWCLVSVTLLRGGEGQAHRFVSVVEDITRTKAAQAALESEAQILELLNATGVAIASNLDLQVLVQTATDAATKLSGAQVGAFFYNVIDGRGVSYLLYAISGASASDFAPFGLPRNTPVFDPIFKGLGTLRSDDITQDARYGQMGPHFGFPEGHFPVVSLLAVPVVSRSNEVIGGMFFGHADAAVFTERSERIVVGVAAQAAVAIDNARLFESVQVAGEERKRLLESERAAHLELQRLSELKDEFLATLSHELRTPLSAILGWAQVLRLKPMPREEMGAALDAIERNARVQTQLIEDLLDMSRITSGKLRLDIQPLQPASFVHAAIQTVQPTIDAKGIRLEVQLDPAAGPISGDPSRLQQVVWNLLSNAIKFTPKGGKVVVRLRRVDSHVELSVTDTGIGIDPAFLGHVFERFRQADATATRRYGGLGLGLSIVKHLVEQHGGTVRAHSEGKGLGTTFVVQLPVVAVSQPHLPEPRPHAKAPPTSGADYEVADLDGLRILVVDDEPDARGLVKRLLEDCGATVLAAANGEEALQIARREPLHLLVSDIGMPGMDGYELLQRVRSLPLPVAKIPAIALTAFARSEDRAKALRAGYALHMSKPVEPAELIASVAGAARRSSDVASSS